jgi:tetratricopeptide (TPR) repeat protein
MAESQSRFSKAGQPKTDPTSPPEETVFRDAEGEQISPEAYGHLRQGVVLFKQQQLENAENEIVQAIDLHPPLSPLYNVFALLKIARRAIDTLKQSVYTALTTNPEFMDEFVQEGIKLLAQERFEEAEEQFKKAIALNPNNTDAQFRLGFTHVSRKNYSKAIEVFEQLIMVDPENINAFFMLGMAYSEMREYYPCISNLQYALRLEPAFVEARLTLADAYHNQGKYLISLRELEGLQELIPNEDTTYLHRGMILLELDRKEEAIPYFEKVIELKPDVMEAYELLVGLHIDMGNFERAIYLAETALQMQPENQELLNALEWSHDKQNKLQADS